MQKYCQNCHQSNPSEAIFCLNCAAPLPTTPPSGNRQQNQQWNQTNLGNQQQQNFAPPTNQGASQRAIIAVALTVAGLFCCGPLSSIPAAIVGWMEMDAIKKGQSPPAGMWMAQVGLWGGIIVTILTTIGGFLFLLLSAASSPY